MGTVFNHRVIRVLTNRTLKWGAVTCLASETWQVFPIKFRITWWRGLPWPLISDAGYTHLYMKSSLSTLLRLSFRKTHRTLLLKH